MIAEELSDFGDKEKIIFAIIGSGWRAEFYLRIAKEMPQRFEVCGIVTRSEEKGKLLEQLWGVKTYKDINQLLKFASPAFVVVSVPSPVAPDYIERLAANGVPVLTETPPAPDIETLARLCGLAAGGAKIQVAEQYHLQPLHAARIMTANSGKLGEVSEVQLSVCHGYHAVSLMRKFLGVGFQNCLIRAREFHSFMVDGPGKTGEPHRENIVSSIQTIAQLDFGEKLGLYDFDNQQYFSWVRSLNLQVRGSRGQICDKTVKYLKDYKTPVEYELKRRSAGEDGNLEGYYLKGIMAGEEWVYKNPFIPAKLTDDEIAVACCLDKMNRFTRGGPEFYSVADAAQDHYLSMMIKKAVVSNQTVVTQTQAWAEQQKQSFQPYHPGEVRKVT